MKAILEFTLNETKNGEWINEEKDLKRAVNASNAYAAIRELMNDVFRPTRKHGDPEIDRYLKDVKIPEDLDELDEIVSEVISKLEDRAWSVINEYVNLDDEEG